MARSIRLCTCVRREHRQQGCVQFYCGSGRGPGPVTGVAAARRPSRMVGSGNRRNAGYCRFDSKQWAWAASQASRHSCCPDVYHSSVYAHMALPHTAQGRTIALRVRWSSGLHVAGAHLCTGVDRPDAASYLQGDVLNVTKSQRGLSKGAVAKGLLFGQDFNLLPIDFFCASCKLMLYIFGRKVCALCLTAVDYRCSLSFQSG